MTVTTLPLLTDLFIDGRWAPAAAGRRSNVVNPATAEVITTVADADPDDALRAAQAAASAQPAWARLAPRERGEVLRRTFELMVERQEAIAELITLENGKAFSDAIGEVAYAAEFFRWYAEEAVRLAGEVKRAPSGANRIVVEYQPIGVALLVTPWNFPAAMITRKIAPALAAGCGVVVKPAPQTPLTALVIADLLTEAGVPAGVVNVVTTTAAEPVVASLLHDRRIRALSFTGSTAVGRILLRAAADRVLKCSMELGGNAPFIILDDADLAKAIDGLMIAKMRNGGQACTAANRVLVHNTIRPRLVEGLARRMAALRVGAGIDRATQCGAIIDERGLTRIAALVDDAVDRGAVRVTGGRRLSRPGYFYEPTVIDGVPADAPILREEIFGPIATVVGFNDEEEAIAAANDTEFGLASYVYTRDLARGLRIAERVETGMVGVNRGLVSDPAAPFGGVKQSGLGREGAHDGILEFAEAKYIAVDW